jgi:23S rRNA pseudouridine1911/1915/1917 synthase
MKYELIKSTPEYLVINKPAGLLAHSGPKLDEESLADLLRRDYPEIAKVGDDPYRPGLVHRLDKLASGLMVVARTPEAFEHLKTQFQNRDIMKNYTALCYGNVTADTGEINFPIQRKSEGFKMAALPLLVKGEPNPDGRRAETEFTAVKRFVNYTLLKVRIKTGRTHQIRVHFAAYGYPLVGDDLYGTAKTRIKNKKLALTRIFLVANELEFTDLTGAKQNFKIDLPEELAEFLNSIK